MPAATSGKYSSSVSGVTFQRPSILTPGVKVLGLWNVTAATLEEYFPDVAAGTAPEWRVQSYRRILESL